MGVNQHVVIEPVDRVVQGGGVKAKLHSRGADRVPEVPQAQPDSGGKAIADAFLLASPTHRLGVWISEDEAHLGPLLGLGRKQLGDLWIAVWQEQPGQRPERRCGRSWPLGGCATALLVRRRGWDRG